jgi:hypothetical protein
LQAQAKAYDDQMALSYRFICSSDNLTMEFTSPIGGLSAA